MKKVLSIIGIVVLGLGITMGFAIWQKLTETTLQDFFIAMLIDRNLNGIIEEGELRKFTIRLK